MKKKEKTYHLTWINVAGLASYSQNNKKSAVSFTVMLSGLTVTTGGSRVLFLFLNVYWKIMKPFNYKYLHITSSTIESCIGLSRSSRITILSASQRIVAPFSKRVAVNIRWPVVMNVPSFCKS